MTKQKVILCLLGLGVAGIAQADTIFNGGNMFTAGNWTAGVPNSAGDPVGIVNVDGTIPGVSQADTTFAGATITVGGGATITTGADLPAGGSVTWIFNDATVNLGDDLFDNGSIITLNAGSAVNANQDFEVQGTPATGAININDGTHTAGRYFGFQGGNRSASLSFLGGTVTAGQFRFNNNTTGASYMDLGGSATATATGATVAGNIDGTVNVLSGWSGFLTAANFSGTAWRDAVLAGDWSLGGTAVDGTVFDANFTVTSGGTTLALIPEPSTLGLMAFVGGLLLMRRRRS